jgi:hypothetical protein
VFEGGKNSLFLPAYKLSGELLAERARPEVEARKNLQQFWFEVKM